jgi:hypothetical protein
MQEKQITIVLGMLSFLGTAALLTGLGAALVATWMIGEERLSRGLTAVSGWAFGGRGLAAKVFATALLLAGGYVAVLLSASLASHTYVLGLGEEKYFCEIDCHVAYAVVGVEKTKLLGEGANSQTATGTFYVVTIRTRFDENTISSHRGDSPLAPSPRVVTLVDDQGRRYDVSAAGEQALAQSLGTGKPMTEPLRPGESYTTQVVFDLPPGARNPRLLIESPTNPRWIGFLLIGDEGSLFHKKVFLGLESSSGSLLPILSKGPARL